MNPFIEGQQVVCISDYFPWIPKYGGVGLSPIHPRINEVLTINDTLGDFLRFYAYDTPELTNW